MIRFKKIKFINHPVLKDLELDFSDKSGNCVDTVIFAGENGVGKSTIIESLFKVVSWTVDFESDVSIIDDKGVENVLKYRKKEQYFMVNSNYQFDNNFQKNLPMSGIFSDVDINFKSHDISTVTSLVLDNAKESRKSDSDLPNKIKQLLIDIQAQDDAELSALYREAKGKGLSTETIQLNERMPRFTSAFNKMFSDLTYKKIENINNKKSIIFNKFGENIPIDQLSSGEKQIVYRGCFLLKDKNAMKGATVFVDEPEISLHPLWQEKILDYYKDIFTDENGIQTSQIFVVTHSPFIIHNKNRKNDKVIVMSRDKEGKICALDKPYYYKCDSKEVVEDAFNINTFQNNLQNMPTVYLEGRTDEKYFNKVIEVFNYKNFPFKFKWVGFIDERGNEVYTGHTALDQAYKFVRGLNLGYKNVFLFDCDTNRQAEKANNAYTKSLSKYDNNRFKVGVENALVIPEEEDISKFYVPKETSGNYGEKKTIEEFKKMEFCDYICSQPAEKLKDIFVNLKQEVDKLVKLFNE